MTILPWIAAAAALTLPSATAPDTPSACRAKISQVREAGGLAKLDDSPAAPEEALLIKAVDRRVDGCRVLTMARDTRDIRPEPAPADGRALLRRVR